MPNQNEEEPHNVSTGKKKVPEHLQELYNAGQQGCKELGQSTQLARLLTRYGAVFSKGDSDIDGPSLVEHNMPIEESTHLIKQPFSA